jgi:hypothetical protein
LNERTVSANSSIHFPVHNIKLTAKTNAPLERTRNFGLKTWKLFNSYFYAITAPEEHGIHTSIYAGRAGKQSVTYYSYPYF